MSGCVSLFDALATDVEQRDAVRLAIVREISAPIQPVSERSMQKRSPCTAQLHSGACAIRIVGARHGSNRTINDVDSWVELGVMTWPCP